MRRNTVGSRPRLGLKRFVQHMRAPERRIRTTALSVGRQQVIVDGTEIRPNTTGYVWIIVISIPNSLKMVSNGIVRQNVGDGRKQSCVSATVCLADYAKEWQRCRPRPKQNESY